MKKNNYSKNEKRFIICSCVTCGIITIVLILVAAFLENEIAANVVSIIASILSAVLSVVAIIYTVYSNIQTDAKLKEILKMGKSMQAIETEIKKMRDGGIVEQTPELQEKLKRYEDNLENIDQFFR